MRNGREMNKMPSARVSFTSWSRRCSPCSVRTSEPPIWRARI